MSTYLAWDEGTVISREAGELTRAGLLYWCAVWAVPLAVVTLVWRAQRWVFRWRWLVTLFLLLS